MEITAHFSEILSNISEEIKKAKYNIFVAVAWITDKTLWTILEKKAQEGVVVQVILVPDEINNNNKTDYTSFLELGGQIYWDNHHHKFCVIDVKTVITGSYNWTYMANIRDKRENIIILKQNSEIAEQFSDEFKILLKQSKQFQLPKEKEIIYLEREIEKEVIKEVEVEKLKIKTIYIEENSKKLNKPKHIANFIGGWVICSKCNTALNKKNYCTGCNILYTYNSSSNKYEYFESNK